MGDIQKAYVALFGNEQQLIGTFSNQDLRILQACWNLIVHKGGIVDHAFKNITQYDFPALQIGNALPLDGALVAKLVNASVACGCDLLSYADDFLMRTEEPTAA